MNSPKIDFQSASKEKVLPTKTPAKKTKKRWPVLLLKISLYALVFLIIFGFSLSYRVILSSEGIFSRQNMSFFDQIKHLVTSGDKQIKGESNDRINILLLGYGGAGHDGAYLSDTIIVASLKPSTNEAALLSIPRDLYVSIPEYGWRKINNANAFGYLADPKKGGETLLADVLEDVLAQPIDYYASVDFSGLKKLVDLVGGVEINVDKTFSDYEYPDNNYGYQTISFKAGSQNMDGDTSLKYVRSRHGTNGEGSDFARSRRQQKVLSALKKDIFSLGTLINPKKIVDISETVGSHLKTNMEVWEIVRLADLLGEVDPGSVINRVLDSTPSGLLYSETTIDGAYILKPRADDYSEIQALAKNIFQYSSVSQEAAKIEVQNGTKISGLAETTSNRLKELGYDVVKITNAEELNLAETQIYDLSLGQKSKTLELLKWELNGTVISSSPFFTNDSDSTVSNQTNAEHTLANSLYNLSNTPAPQTSDADILIILGNDAYNSSLPINSSVQEKSLTNQ
ncbi:MAG: LCP family protein [Patescibacteria group bacterium]|nr:LCP family protein [Patescibacteria group bacterium]